jgi:flagellar motor switch protein FliN/FliY
MDPKDVAEVARFLMQDPSVEVSEEAVKTVEEVFSTFSSAFSAKYIEKFGKQASITSPSHAETFKEGLDLPSSLLVQSYELTIGDERVSFYEVFDDKILSLFEPIAPKPANNSMPTASPSAGGSNMSDKNQMPNVQGVQYPNLTNDEVMYEQGNIGLLMDVPMEVTVELGRAKRLIKDILSMGEGTIISLDKLAGEPIDILVNHKLIARGEVVVIDENFGVRVTEILSGKEKLFGNTSE